MRALGCAALVAIWGHCALAFFPGYFPPSNVREASQNYYEVMTNCEREGGECVDVDFGGPKTDPPSVPETETPAPTTTPRPRRRTTRAPAPPPPTAPTQNPFFFWFPFWPTTSRPYVPPAAPMTPAPPAPLARTPAPFAPTPAPPRAPVRAATRAPRPSTAAPAKATRAPRKVGRKGRRRNNKRKGGEQEREVRRRRQAMNPDPWDYLYNECSGGWEFDYGCSARGANVCCYSSNSNSPSK